MQTITQTATRTNAQGVEMTITRYEDATFDARKPHVVHVMREDIHEGRAARFATDAEADTAYGRTVAMFEAQGYRAGI